jgi:hypothetical protein
VFVSRALKSVLVDLSLPKRRALFDFLRDPQFVKSKLTYLFFADREETMDRLAWVEFNENFGLRCHFNYVGFTTRDDECETRCVHKDGQIRNLSFFQKMSFTGEGGFVNPDFARNCESVNVQSPMTEGATIFELYFKTKLN